MTKQLSTEKSYTVRQISELMEVPIRTIHDSIDRLFPYIKENGKTTYLTESMVTDISQDLKRSHNSNLASTGKVVMTKKEEDMIIVNAMSILQNRLKELQPKAEAFDRLIQTHNTISIGEFSKSIGWGRNNFYKELRKKGYMDGYNIPYQKYMKYFEVRHIEKNGVNYPTAFINSEGINYFSKIICEK